MKILGKRPACRILLILLCITAIAWFWPTRAKVLRYARNSDAHAAWHEAYKVRRAMYQLTWNGNHDRLCHFLQDDDPTIRFVAAWVAVGRGMKGSYLRDKNKSGSVTAINGFTEADIQRVFDVLDEGFASTDPETEGLRGRMAGHLPTMIDRRMVRTLAIALSHGNEIMPFADMDLGNLMGNMGPVGLGSHYGTGRSDPWLDKLINESSNLVWNGDYFTFPGITTNPASASR